MQLIKPMVTRMEGYFFAPSSTSHFHFLLVIEDFFFSFFVPNWCSLFPLKMLHLRHFNCQCRAQVDSLHQPLGNINNPNLCWKPLEFICGLPSRYSSGPMLLYYSIRTRTGVFNITWSLTASSFHFINLTCRFLLLQCLIFLVKMVKSCPSQPHLRELN